MDDLLLTQAGFEHTHLQNERLLHLLVQYQNLDRFVSSDGLLFYNLVNSIDMMNQKRKIAERDY